MSAAEVEVYEEHPVPRQTGGVLQVDDPAEMIAKASGIARQLQDVVRQAGLVKRIADKDYLLVEAWTTLGVLVGCTARTEWTRPVGDGDGWEAAVEVVNSNGVVVSRAEAECLRTESLWRKRDDYALRSMAQTRAMGKALRMPLGWIAVLAGYQATPAEEMPAQPDVPDDGEFRFQTGKHKGKTLAETPREYLRWYEREGPKQDVREAIATFLALDAAGQYPDDSDLPFA